MNHTCKNFCWLKEPGVRLQGSNQLDQSKVQAPCIVRIPSGGFRLYYTAIGPERPFKSCQGYILSAISDDGLTFYKEPGIRLAPQPNLPHMCLRVLAPSITHISESCWRMYFEARGEVGLPTVICSATTYNLLDWKVEGGIRLMNENGCGVGGPRYLALSKGKGRLYCFISKYTSREPKTSRKLSQSIISAITSDGLNFEFEPGSRIKDNQDEFDSKGITAAEVIPPYSKSGKWTMFYSAWQDVTAGLKIPMHPSVDIESVSREKYNDFATASITSDMAGYRSRIFIAQSNNGLVWERGGCVIEGGGYQQQDLDAVHAEDMSLIKLSMGNYRMYYAACDNEGTWRILSAVTPDTFNKNQ